MPKKKRAKKPMKPLAQRFPQVTVRMALEQVYGAKKDSLHANKHKQVEEEILAILKSTPRENVRSEIQETLQYSYPEEGEMTAISTTGAILRALGKN